MLHLAGAERGRRSRSSGGPEADRVRARIDDPSYTRSRRAPLAPCAARNRPEIDVELVLIEVLGAGNDGHDGPLSRSGAARRPTCSPPERAAPSTMLVAPCLVTGCSGWYAAPVTPPTTGTVEQ